MKYFTPETWVFHRENLITAVAAAAHDVNRAWCLAHGDTSQVPWRDAPGWQRQSAINGVEGVLKGNTPHQSHDNWLREKEATGWVYGPVKDVDAKTHPCMVPYEELSPVDRAKDTLFVDTVRDLASELCLLADAPAAIATTQPL